MINYFKKSAAQYEELSVLRNTKKHYWMCLLQRDKCLTVLCSPRHYFGNRDKTNKSGKGRTIQYVLWFFVVKLVSTASLSIQFFQTISKADNFFLSIQTQNNFFTSYFM